MTTLYVIQARQSDRAVIFRRGPSKQVLLIAWDTATDQFEEGQWFKGRIYERRGDLSPDGELLIYFAANWKKPHSSWTAVSRPPFLTALAFWPKGDGWGGGGHFLARGHIALNHRANEMEPGSESRIPNWLKVSPFGQHSGWGEDDPVWGERLARDGWVLTSHGRQNENAFDAKVWITFDPPIVWEKRHPIWPDQYILRMQITGIKERNGRWYRIEHKLNEIEIGRRIEWADWARNGDLLFAAGGRLYRASLPLPLQPRLLADFTDRVFQGREAPVEATRWGARKM